jgi:two-component system, cell cycle sensor histidine kinase and response regulator CckA
MNAANPDNEKKRLNVLWQYEVLDTVPEALFDDLTELAAGICEAPIALISLVDEKRQWFKSRFGTTVTETSRDISFCAHAIQQNDLFIIPDATKDDRFARNPLVTSDPKIRFYAGAPLISPDGYALGTLCVIDKVPRDLRPQQKQALRILARHIVSQLEQRRRSLEIRDARSGSPGPGASGTQAELARLTAELAAANHKLAQLAPTKAARSSRKAKPPVRASRRTHGR